MSRKYFLERTAKVSKERTVKVPEKFQSKQEVSEDLNKHYSGGGRYLSEGGDKPIYYVDGENRYKVIEDKGHSQWKRNLGGGKNVGAHGQQWFGPRAFPFKGLKEQEEKQKPEESSLNQYLKEIKRLQKDELKQLSDFLNKYNDEQGCEIIDVIWSCKSFRKDLMERKDGPIKDELKLSLGDLTELSNHDKIETAGGDLKKVIASVIYIKKINFLCLLLVVMGLIAVAGAHGYAGYRAAISSGGMEWYSKGFGSTKAKDGVALGGFFEEFDGFSSFKYDDKTGETVMGTIYGSSDGTGGNKNACSISKEISDEKWRQANEKLSEIGQSSAQQSGMLVI